MINPPNNKNIWGILFFYYQFRRGLLLGGGEITVECGPPLGAPPLSLNKARVYVVYTSRFVRVILAQGSC